MQEFAYSEELHNMLSDDEDVLWEGMPQRLAYILSGWQLSVPGAFFFGFACVWTWMATGPLREGARFEGSRVFAWLFPLFGVPFVLVGLHMFLGHYILKAAQWKSVHYMITSDRVLILKGLAGSSVTTVPLSEIDSLSLHKGAGNVGTISLLTGGPAPASPFPRQSRSGRGTPALIGVQNPDEVYRILTGAIVAHEQRREV